MRKIKKVLIIIIIAFISISCTQSVKDDNDDSKMYVVILGTKKYHRNTCTKVKDQPIGPITLEKAKKNGYEKCNVCFTD